VLVAGERTVVEGALTIDATCLLLPRRRKRQSQRPCTPGKDRDVVDREQGQQHSHHDCTRGPDARRRLRLAPATRA
jgi:hypothetical protein